MFKLPIVTWICNAAAVFARRHGAVTEQAQREGCSRQTVYAHAQQLPERLHDAEGRVAELQAQVRQLTEQRRHLQRQLDHAVPIDTPALQRFAVTAQASGISLRQTEELLATLLPEARVPDHATLGRWSRTAAQRAGDVLATLDPRCAPAVRSASVDEIFLRG
jgi:TolA-binding protein